MITFYALVLFSGEIVKYLYENNVLEKETNSVKYSHFRLKRYKFKIQLYNFTKVNEENAASYTSTDVSSTETSSRAHYYTAQF